VASTAGFEIKSFADSSGTISILSKSVTPATIAW